jgi:hypothetical protein
MGNGGGNDSYFYPFSDRSMTLHPDPLTSETSSSKAIVDRGSRAALVGSGVGSKVRGSQRRLRG